MVELNLCVCASMNIHMIKFNNYINYWKQPYIPKWLKKFLEEYKYTINYILLMQKYTSKYIRKMDQLVKCLPFKYEFRSPSSV